MPDYETLTHAERRRLEELVRAERETPAPKAKRAERRPRKLKPADEAALVARYQAGGNSPQLAEEYKVSRQAVVNMVRRAGGKVRPRGGKDRRFSADESMEVKERYEAGEASKDLAAEFNVAVSTICRAVRDAGGAVRKAGARPKRERAASRHANCGFS